MYSKRTLGRLIVSLLLRPQFLRDTGFWLSFLYHLLVKMNPFRGLKAIKIEMEMPLFDLGLMGEGNVYKPKGAWISN